MNPPGDGNRRRSTTDPLQPGTDSERKREIVGAANAILVGASLIASITYASWLLLPYDNIVHKKAVKVFGRSTACLSFSQFQRSWFVYLQ
jgi:hypothetical protein